MSTTTPSKTQGTTLLAHTQQAANTPTIGSAIDVTGKWMGRVFVRMGRTTTTALTADVVFRLEASAKSSGNDEWYPLRTWTSKSAKTAASSSTVNDAAFNAADTSFTITSATGFAAPEQIYFRETGTPANSEWSKISGVSGTTITLEEGITRNHTNGITVTDLAEEFSFDVDLQAVGRLRLVVEGGSQAVDLIGWLNTLDNATTAA